jgi:hypothetical protein
MGCAIPACFPAQRRLGALPAALKAFHGLSMPGNDNCELRELVIASADKQALDCELVCYFERFLLPQENMKRIRLFPSCFSG